MGPRLMLMAALPIALRQLELRRSTLHGSPSVHLTMRPFTLAGRVTPSLVTRPDLRPNPRPQLSPPTPLAILLLALTCPVGSSPALTSSVCECGRRRLVHRLPPRRGIRPRGDRTHTMVAGASLPSLPPPLSHTRWWRVGCSRGFLLPTSYLLTYFLLPTGGGWAARVAARRGRSPSPSPSPSPSLSLSLSLSTSTSRCDDRSRSTTTPLTPTARPPHASPSPLTLSPHPHPLSHPGGSHARAAHCGRA